jgi:hypothetical protein
MTEQRFSRTTTAAFVRMLLELSVRIMTTANLRVNSIR